MKENINHILMLLMMIITGTLTLTDDQVKAIGNIIMGSILPSGNTSSVLPPSEAKGETICGMNELAKFLGVSVPTACKLSQSGKFDSARLNFGTRKFCWDKAKLLEIARGK